MTTQELPNANATDKPRYAIFGIGPLDARTFEIWFCPSPTNPATWAFIGRRHDRTAARNSVTEYLRLRKIARDIGCRSHA